MLLFTLEGEMQDVKQSARSKLRPVLTLSSSDLWVSMVQLPGAKMTSLTAIT